MFIALSVSVLAACVPPTGQATGGRPRVLWAGDSVAWSMMVARNVAPPLSVETESVAALGCGIATGDLRYGSTWAAWPSWCADLGTQWAFATGAYRPDLVVVQIGAWEVFDRRLPDGRVLNVGSAEWHAWIRALLASTTGYLAATGAKVVWLTSPCFERPARIDGKTDWVWVAEECWRVQLLNEIMRQHVSADPGRNALIELASWLDATGYDDTARTDGVHFDAEYGRATPVLQWLSGHLRALAGF